VCGGIASTLHGISGCGDHDTVTHRDRAYRDLTARAGRTSHLQRTTHEALVGGDRYPTATSGSSTFSPGRSTTRIVSSTKRTRSNVMQFTGQWSSQILQLVQRS